MPNESINPQDGRARYESDREFPVREFPLAVRRGVGAHRAHSHDFCEIVFVARGSARHVVGDPTPSGQGQRESWSYPLVEGDAFVIMAETVHGYTEASQFEIFNVLFQPSILGAEIEPLRKVDGFADFFLTEPLFRSETAARDKLRLPVEARQMVTRILERLESELRERTAGYQVMTRSLFIELLVILARGYAAASGQWAATGTGEFDARRAAVARAVAYMEQHAGETLTLPDVAAKAFLSPNYFCEVFREVTGLPPMQYLNHVRLDRARMLLQTTTRGVTEIAMDCGFADGSYFAKVFKAAEGMTPTDYRRRSPQRAG